jgi:cytochrome c551/c552
LASAEVGSDGVVAQGIGATRRSIDALIDVHATTAGVGRIAIAGVALTCVTTKGIGTATVGSTYIAIAFVNVGTTGQRVAFVAFIAKASVCIRLTKRIWAASNLSISKTFAQLIVWAGKVIETRLMIANFGTNVAARADDIRGMEQSDP